MNRIKNVMMVVPKLIGKIDKHIKLLVKNNTVQDTQNEEAVSKEENSAEAQEEKQPEKSEEELQKEKQEAFNKEMREYVSSLLNNPVV